MSVNVPRARPRQQVLPGRRAILAPQAAGGERRQFCAVGGATGNFRGGRRIRQRQIHHRQHDPRHRTAEQRSSALQRRRHRQRSMAATPAKRSWRRFSRCVPESVRGFQSAEPDRRISVRHRAPFRRRRYAAAQIRDRRQRFAARRLSMAEIKDRFPHELSGGQFAARSRWRAP